MLYYTILYYAILYCLPLSSSALEKTIAIHRPVFSLLLVQAPAAVLELRKFSTDSVRRHPSLSSLSSSVGNLKACALHVYKKAYMYICICTYMRVCFISFYLYSHICMYIYTYMHACSFMFMFIYDLYLNLQCHVHVCVYLH